MKNDMINNHKYNKDYEKIMCCELYDFFELSHMYYKYHKLEKKYENFNGYLNFIFEKYNFYDIKKDIKIFRNNRNMGNFRNLLKYLI